MRYKKYIIALLIFIAGTAFGHIIATFWNPYGHSHSAHHHSHMSGFRYTNPLLDCEISAEENHDRELKPFKYKVKEFIEQAKAQQRAESVSVYFRDLDNGTSFGVNSRQKFSPASLMKVPVMMGYLKKAEADPAILKQVMVFDGKEDWNAMQNLKPAQTIVAGKEYTVDDLISRMMKYSDNNAWSVLFKNIGPGYLDRILSEIHVDYDPSKSENFMSVKAYASFYRVLYNASYLSRPMSEKALEYLASSDFNQGIMAGVPAGTTVVTKFGERILDERPEMKQLHEFGIVYYKKHPYLLGIMTQGRDFKSLTEVLRDISRLIYAEVDGHAQRGEEH